MFFSNLLCIICCLVFSPSFVHGKKVDNDPAERPLNIAHRGSSGVFPEHSIAAYQRAIQDGADFVECDVTLTGDRKLICNHENYLSATTDVATRPEFASKNNTYNGQNDWWAVDFTLEELRSLRRIQRFDFRDPSENGNHGLVTLDEYIDVVQAADRPVGIYPETKDPEWLNSLPFMNGTTFEDLLLEVLNRRGYSSAGDPCFIQSFSVDSLRYLANRTELRLVILLWVDVPDETIAEWGTFCYGIGPWKEQIARYYEEESYKNWISNETDFVRTAHNAGMKVHVYTLRNEDAYLAWDFHQDPYEEIQYFIDKGVDGFFTDFPKTLDRFLDKQPVTRSGSTRRPWLPLWILLTMALLLLF